MDDEGGKHYHAHQNVISVKVGDEIKAGTLIGYMGNTGNVIGGPYSDRKHLHYGYRPAEYDRNNGYGGFIDPMTFFEKEELPEMSQPGWAEIVCDDGANVRNEPAGIWRTWLPKGIRVHKAGECQPANGLQWEKIDGNFWIARADATGTMILKNVEE